MPGRDVQIVGLRKKAKWERNNLKRKYSIIFLFAKKKIKEMKIER